MAETVSDERLAELIGAAKRSNYVLYVLCDGTSDALDALVELRDRRAAEREQAAPTEPRLAKWERQLREMGGTVEYNRDTGLYEATGEGVKWDCADTAKAAIAAAWRAWKEARRDA